MSSKILAITSGIISLFVSATLSAKDNSKPLRIVTTTVDIAWAARHVGGEGVEVESLLSGREDPHYADALPDFIFKVNRADIVCQVGMGLEVGWLPKVLTRSGNAQVQKGGKGYCELGKFIKPLGIPTGPIDRSMGDIHPEGNPHFWPGPEAFSDSAQAIYEALAAVDPANTEKYLKNLQSLQTKLKSIKEKISQKLKPWQNTERPIVTQYHKEFSYFFEEFNINSLGSIEEKPGVPPSAGRLAQFGIAAKENGIKLGLAKPSDPDGVLTKFKEVSGVSVKKLPIMMIKGELEDYETMLTKIADSFSLVKVSKLNK